MNTIDISPTLILWGDLCLFMTYKPNYVHFSSRLGKLKGSEDVCNAVNAYTVKGINKNEERKKK